ncbi:MAG TPA: UDP-N-acetylmuramoyl-L-alanyl-D-glutamate--2,6-diaminopimelate ligase [Pelolinea sp.]|nr:UDP-N-acetylmuramoyl-L-alanyl-D-glutamate--2,6-diaminopimelate ligase [Pelolinea sp.]
MRLPNLIAQSTQFPDIRGDIPEIEITGISFDSRCVEPGHIFFALEGGNVDAHQFIPHAIQNGALAVVGRKVCDPKSVNYFQVENPRKAMAYVSAAFYDHPARELTVIGVTGTDGKTTTVNLIFRILLECGIRAGMISTVNAVIGEETIDTGFHVTTPESPMIQQLLRKMVDAGITHVVLEATSHGLDQFRVDACEFDIGVVTNITHEHLDYHGSYDQYFNAKFKLFNELMSTSMKEIGNYRCAVFNRDDISFKKIAKKLENPLYSKIKNITYGVKPDSNIFADQIIMGADGLSFQVHLKNIIENVKSPLIGDYNAHNILAAISATAVGLNLDNGQVVKGVSKMTDVPGRMERVDLGQDFLAFVDFAHTPNALKVTLETSRKLTSQRVIAIFGSAGLRDREKRKLMAAVSSDLADITILTAEDPRTEKLDDILADMAAEAKRKGAVEGENFLVVPDRGEAIREGVNLARSGDLVIACGKGHEQSMCFGEMEYPWDDRIAMRSTLSVRLGVEGPAMPYLPTSD